MSIYTFLFKYNNWIPYCTGLHEHLDRHRTPSHTGQHWDHQFNPTLSGDHPFSIWISPNNLARPPGTTNGLLHHLRERPPGGWWLEWQRNQWFVTSSWHRSQWNPAPMETSSQWLQPQFNQMVDYVGHDDRALCQDKNCCPPLSLGPCQTWIQSHPHAPKGTTCPGHH